MEKTAKKSTAELMKELEARYREVMEIAKKEAEAPTALTAESVESIMESSVEDVPVEKKPPFESGKYKTLGGYFRVDEGVYAVLKRNIQKSVNTLLLGPTGVN